MLVFFGCTPLRIVSRNTNSWRIESIFLSFHGWFVGEPALNLPGCGPLPWIMGDNSLHHLNPYLGGQPFSTDSLWEERVGFLWTFAWETTKITQWWKGKSFSTNLPPIFGYFKMLSFQVVRWLKFLRMQVFTGVQGIKNMPIVCRWMCMTIIQKYQL